MDNQGKSPAAAGTAARAETTGEEGKRSTRPLPKNKLTLIAIMERSSSSDPRDWLNRFSAEKICADHTLPSTISELCGKGLVFERREITVTGYAGKPARIMAYRLREESRSRALELLAAP